MIEVVVAMIGAIAVVSAATVPVMLSLRKARDENREQHATNQQQFQTEIGNLAGKIDVVHINIRDMRKDFVYHLENHSREKANVE